MVGQTKQRERYISTKEENRKKEKIEKKREEREKERRERKRERNKKGQKRKIKWGRQEISLVYMSRKSVQKSFQAL